MSYRSNSKGRMSVQSHKSRSGASSSTRDKAAISGLSSLRRETLAVSRERGSAGTPYMRLMEDLSSEFGRLSAQVADLQKEREKLRRENLELNELVTCGLQQTEVLKEPPPTEATAVRSAPSGLDLYKLDSMRETMGSTSPQIINGPPRDSEAFTTPPTKSLSVGEEVEMEQLDFINEEMPSPPMNTTPVQCRPVQAVNPDNSVSGDGKDGSQGSARMSDFGDVDSALEEDEEVAQERIKLLRDQFDRLDKTGKGMLSAHDCWAVVSHIENQKYGHVKHEYKRVLKTIKAVDGVKLHSPRGSVDETRAAAFASEVGIHFEQFCELMHDSPHDEPHVENRTVYGEDVSYLRKAFQWESNEHLTQMARQNIAQRQQICRDPQPTGWLRFLLETLPPIIISANALVIGLQNDIPSEVWDYVEKVFLAFYITEFSMKVRLMGVVRYFRGNDGRWNCFDFACLLSGLFDLGLEIYKLFAATVDGGSAALLPLLKVVRLARLARIVRSFRYKIFEDLKSMVSGVFSGARVLWWSIVLLFIVVYTLGVLMRQVIGNDQKEFANLPSAMFTVFRCFTDGCAAYDGTPLQERLRLDLEMTGYGGIFMIGYILMFLVVTVGVFNLIMAIFIDNVVSTTVKRKQQELGAREDEMKVSIEEMLVRLIKTTTNTRATRTAVHNSIHKSVSINPNVSKEQALRERAHNAAEGMAFLRAQDVVITRDLFNAWLTDPDMLALLDDMEIDIATKFEIFDVCDVDKSGSLTPDELVSGLMRLRGPISKCDIIAVRLKVRYLCDMLEDMHTTLCM